MNILCRILAVFVILLLVGCGTTGGGGGSAPSASSSDSGGWSAEKLKEMGIQETYGKRN